MQNNNNPSLISFLIDKHEQKLFWVDLALIFLAFAALFVHSIPVQQIAAIVMIYVILRCNLYENVFGFIVFLPDIAGCVFNPLEINHVGGIIKYLGLAVLLVLILLRRANMSFTPKGLFPLVILLLLLTVSVFTTFGGDHAEPKLIATIRHGLTLFFAYSFLFSNAEKFDFTKQGVLFIVLAIFLVPMSIPVNDIEGPTDLLDFGFLRYQTHEEFLDVIEDDSFHISYQGSGFLLLIGYGFFMIESKKHKLWQSLLFLGIVTLALLYIGSRQAIVSIFAMAFVWALIINRNNSVTNRNKMLGHHNRTYRDLFSFLGRWFIIALVAGLTYYLISVLTAEEGLLESIAAEGFVEGGGRGDFLLAGIDQFLSHPVYGVGYGRFFVFNQYGYYPHNLFIELLCETGLVGFSIAMALGVYAAIKNKKVLKPFLLLWLAYFLRSMISGDISLNIYVFVILFALSSAKYDEIKLLNEREHK